VTSRERVVATINRSRFDRVPYTFSAVPELYNRLKTEIGFDDQAMLEKFGGDIRFIEPLAKNTASNIRYADPTIEITPEGFYRDIWGVDFDKVHHGSGVYIDLVRSPLEHIDSVDELNDYPYWPSVDSWDHSNIKEQCIANNQYATIGHTRGFFEIGWFMRGMGNFLTDLLLNEKLACELMDRVLDYLLQRMEHILSAASGTMTMFEINDDVGSQNGLLISPTLWRKFIKPRLKRQVDLCKRYGVKVQYHSCGSVATILPDLIEIGIDVLNPVQSLAQGMDPFVLKREYGKYITFHGCVDEQYLLPYGTPAEIRDYVKRLIDEVGKDGGLIVAPCHALQIDTPTENVVALYETFWN
jgi:uroporphyrinogen decarboxylase